MDKTYMVVEFDGVGAKSSTFNNLKDAKDHYMKVVPKNGVENVHISKNQEIRVTVHDKVTVTLHA